MLVKYLRWPKTNFCGKRNKSKSLIINLALNVDLVNICVHIKLLMLVAENKSYLRPMCK